MPHFGRLLHLIHHSSTFLITTLGEDAYPATMAISRPLKTEGLNALTFYIDNQSEAAKNVQLNTIGSVFCFEEDTHESLLLKGSFSLLPIDDPDYVYDSLTRYQRTLDHQSPILLHFSAHYAKANFNQLIKTFDLTTLA